MTAPACALPYHRPGSRVKWDRYSRDAKRIVIVTGTVISHERRQITARVEPDGRVLSTSCGCVVRA